MLHWHPTDGETVHLRQPNAWSLPAGRYELERQPATHPRDFLLRGPGAWRTADEAELQAAERATVLTPISRDELARERQEVTLRTLAPLRGRRVGAWRAQHDASALPLFDAAEQGRLL